MSKLIGNNYTTYLVSFLAGFGNFLILPFLFRILTLTDYGIIGIVDSIIVLLSVLVSFNFDQGLTKFFYEWNINDRTKKVSSVFIFSWGLAFFIFLILLLLSTLLANNFFFISEIRRYFFITIYISFFYTFEKIPISYFRITENYHLYNIVVFCNFFLLNAFFILFIFYLNLGLDGYFYSILISKGILSIFYLFFYFKKIKNGFNFSEIRDLVIYSAKSLISNLTNVFFSFSERTILLFFFDIKSVGLITAISKVASVISSLHNTIKVIYVPKLMKEVFAIKPKLETLSMQYFFPVYLIACLLIFFSIPISHLFALGNIPDINNQISLISLSVFLTNSYMYISPGIFISDRPHLIIYPIIISMIVLYLPMFFFKNNLNLNIFFLLKSISSLFYILSAYIISKKIRSLVISNQIFTFSLIIFLFFSIFFQTIVSVNLFFSIVFFTIAIITYLKLLLPNFFNQFLHYIK
jgi:O-antigen/teichoic acid export membrane protein